MQKGQRVLCVCAPDLAICYMVPCPLLCGCSPPLTRSRTAGQRFYTVQKVRTFVAAGHAVNMQSWLA